MFEDIVGMYLSRMLPQLGGFALTYDVSEVGAGKKGYKQVLKTAEKTKPKYSVIISNNELEYSEEHNAIKIPFKYFLLG